MMHRAFRWLRRMLPRDWILSFCVALYFTAEIIFVVIRWRYAIVSTELLETRDSAVLLMCAVYGLYRVLAFHPFYQEEYYQWLVRTPWTSRLPLPLGPVHLVIQDALVLGLVCIALHDPQVDLWNVPLWFLLGYLVAICLTFWPTGLWALGYFTAFGLGLVLWLQDNPVAALVVAAALYLAAWWGLHRSLAYFPWPASSRWRTPQRKGAGEKSTFPSLVDLLANPPAGPKSNRRLGWPFGVCDPVDPGIKIQYRDGLLLSLLAGWIMFCAASNFRLPEMATVFYFYALLGSVVYRLFIYCWNYHPPISIWGRLLTLRWIIPGYDRAFVAPLAAAGVGIGLPILFEHMGLPVVISASICLSVVLLVLLCSGPRLQAWKLTGNHRIVPGITNKAEFVKH